MIDGKAQRALGGGITLDPKVGCLPSCPPGISVLSNDAGDVVYRALDVSASCSERLTCVPRRVESDDPIQAVRFPSSDFDVQLIDRRFG